MLADLDIKKIHLSIILGTKFPKCFIYFKVIIEIHDPQTHELCIYDFTFQHPFLMFVDDAPMQV